MWSLGILQLQCFCREEVVHWSDFICLLPLNLFATISPQVSSLCLWLLSCCCDQFNNNYTDDTLAVSLCLINGTGIVLFYTCLPICLPYREGFSKKKTQQRSCAFLQNSNSTLQRASVVRCCCVKNMWTPLSLLAYIYFSHYSIYVSN